MVFNVNFKTSSVLIKIAFFGVYNLYVPTVYISLYKLYRQAFLRTFSGKSFSNTSVGCTECREYYYITCV